LLEQLLYPIDALFDLSARGTSAVFLVEIGHLCHLLVCLWDQLQQVLDLLILEADIASLESYALLLRRVALVYLALKISHLAWLKVAERACAIRGKVQFYIVESGALR